MENNILTPKSYEIISVTHETNHEYTFRVATDIVPEHGQFLQLSLPKIGEAPISVSGFGLGYMDFTIRSVGKVTDELFKLQSGDKIFLPSSDAGSYSGTTTSSSGFSSSGAPCGESSLLF